jgi:DNA-directed RNA polymerase subunit alpha
MEFVLPSKTNVIKEDKNLGVFEIEGLYPGYGLTVGIALRRVLLSSLPGSVITTVRIKGVQHEFSTIPHIKEDVIQILLNLKKIRVKTFSNEPQTLTLLVKGEKKVFASDIERNSSAEIINSDVFIATLTDKKAELEITMTVESGLGYVPSELRRKDKLPIGTISLDALFSPIVNVNYEVEDMRVGERTDYNRLRLHIETDGSISPRQAFKKTCEILTSHFQLIGDIEVPEEKIEEEKEEKPKSEKKGEKKVKKAKK